MDGSLAEDFVSSQLGEPRNLVIDYTQNTLFWIDETHSIIDSINLDGTGRKVRTGMSYHWVKPCPVVHSHLIRQILCILSLI